MNDLNLLDKLPRSAKRGREVWGQRLLWAVALAGVLSCIMVWPLIRAMPRGFTTLMPGVLMGVFLATLFLPCIFFSLLDAPFGVRASGVACATLLFAAATFVGLIMMGVDKSDLNELGRFFAPAAPAGVGCIVLPFMLVRHLFGWQIVMRIWNTTPQRQHVSVAGLMLATLYVAICVLGMMRSPSPLFSAAVCACIAGVGIVVWVPYVYLTIRARNFWIHLIIFYVISVVIGLVYSAVTMIIYSTGGLGLGYFLTPAVVLGSGVAWLGLGFIAMRLLSGELVLNSDFGTAD